MFIACLFQFLGRLTEARVRLRVGVGGCDWSCLRSGQGGSVGHSGEGSDSEDLGELHCGGGVDEL